MYTVLDYINYYKDIPFSKTGWNEIDNLICAILCYLPLRNFEESIKFIDHWIAFGLLAFIGGNMIKEALSKNEDDEVDDKVDFKTMIVLAIATSIDALAIGVTFAFLNVNIVLAVSLIAAITFVISCIGVKLGNVFGDKYEKKAELAGGIVLILIGLKILLEHLGILVL